ncbi:SixA phosphatase family protein [Sphingomicrobium marinum]|uniref:SixA phosphatase family protein n=1 Tax=Sphingomicrobium marinum TaxID=1227950 RepID=UPI002240956C|nr:histidine phosphatase family protein [Sphingomicrobium marinum]
MPELLILRHAKSDWGNPSLRDFDRPLNRRGQKAAPEMGKLISRKGPVDKILASSARRVVETLEGVRKGASELPAAQFGPELYGASVGEIVALLRKHGGDAARILLVGHNPGLHYLALGLTDGEEHPDRDALAHKFPTAGLAHIEFDGGWSQLKEGSGRLLSFTRPKDL